MQLAQELKIFSSACEHILSAIAKHRPLTNDEAAVLKYYCARIEGNIAPILTKQR